MARTAACAPARRAISPRSSGRRTAALFMATLSAPARRIAAASSTESIPPPTQKGIERLRDVRVHEVEVGGIGQRGEPGVHSSPAHAIPTGVRDAHGTGDPPHLAREDPEPGCRGIFLAPFEEKLHPDAEAEERDAPFAYRRDREVEAEPPQLAGAVAEVADTGKDDRPRGEDLGLGPRHAHVC